MCTQTGEHVAASAEEKGSWGATHDVVVLAAHGGCGAGVAASDADDGDGGAGEADKDVQVLEDNTKQAEDRSRAWIASLNNRLW